ncbi:MAG: aminoglycoside phosphotransferase family protein [Rhodomicrobium sp.]
MKESVRDGILCSLRAMKLASDDEKPPLIELMGGVSADIFIAETSQGRICVKRTCPKLKVSGDWYVSPERGEAEKNWIRFVATFLPAHVPEILAEDSHAFTFAMRYLDPERYWNWKSLLGDGKAQLIDAGSVGEILGTIHRKTAGDEAIAAAFANDEMFAALRLRPYLLAAAEANPEVAALLNALVHRTASTKTALVHGDFSPKNILIGPDGPVILDAECAWYGDAAFDPAFCLNHLLLKCTWKPQYTSRYIACAGAFWDAYRAAAGPVCAEDRMTSLLPALMIARLDGKSPVEYLTDPVMREKVRTFAKNALKKPERMLATLFGKWQEEFVS